MRLRAVKELTAGRNPPDTRARTSDAELRDGDFCAAARNGMGTHEVRKTIGRSRSSLLIGPRVMAVVVLKGFW